MTIGKITMPGMRIIKTTLAVFLCLLVSLFRKEQDNNTFFAVIAAVITLKSSIKDSKQSAVVRLQATAFGAVFGLVALKLRSAIGISWHSVGYFVILSVMVFVLIWVSVQVFKSQGTALGAVVFFSIALNHVADVQAPMFALHRFIDTLIGVLIALAVNRILPNKLEDAEQSASTGKD